MLSRVFIVSIFKQLRDFNFWNIFLEYRNATSNENITYGVIQIPQFSTITEKKITVAIPKSLGIDTWEMNSVKKRSKSDNKLVHEDYDMFHFRNDCTKKNYYIFQTSTQNVESLKSEAVILIS